MISLGPRQLYALLLAQAKDASSLGEAETNLRILHDVLLIRLANRGVTKPDEKQVYAELRRMLEEMK